MEDMDYYEWEESKKRFTLKKIIRFIFKLIAGIIIGGTFAILLGRMFLMDIPKAFEGFTWTESAIEAFETGKLAVELQDVYDPFSSKGEYHVSNTALVRLDYTPSKMPKADLSLTRADYVKYSDHVKKLEENRPKSSGEVQFTVRYNNRSTINRLMRLQSLAERPEGEVFVYILSDTNGKVYTEYTVAKGNKPMYDFRRVVFPDVDFTGVKAFYLEVFYIGDVRRPIIYENGKREENMYASFVIYDKSYPKSKIKAAKVGKTDLIFNERPEYVSKFN